ncbi:MAG TPA: hypothetical protein VFL91_23855 [Thermomicrobiales bacterium]|nr:hypothetical protein [Thermomicrobiales bacterium]
MARARLTYSAGNEHNPSDPFGRSLLAIEPDGAARLDHFARFTEPRAWTGRVAPDALDRLWAALGRAGFPAVPSHPVTAGATIRALAVEADGERQTAHVEWYAAEDLPGYDEAFALLDALIRQLTAGEVWPTAPALPAMVGEVRRVS